MRRFLGRFSQPKDHATQEINPRAAGGASDSPLKPPPYFFAALVRLDSSILGLMTEASLNADILESRGFVGKAEELREMNEILLDLRKEIMKGLKR